MLKKIIIKKELSGRGIYYRLSIKRDFSSGRGLTRLLTSLSNLETTKETVKSIDTQLRLELLF